MCGQHLPYWHVGLRNELLKLPLAEAVLGAPGAPPVVPPRRHASRSEERVGGG